MLHDVYNTRDFFTILLGARKLVRKRLIAALRLPLSDKPFKGEDWGRLTTRPHAPPCSRRQRFRALRPRKLALPTPDFVFTWHEDAD